jgi:hypothetical protein
LSHTADVTATKRDLWCLAIAAMMARAPSCNMCGPAQPASAQARTSMRVWRKDLLHSCGPVRSHAECLDDHIGTRNDSIHRLLVPDVTCTESPDCSAQRQGHGAQDDALAPAQSPDEAQQSPPCTMWRLATLSLSTPGSVSFDGVLARAYTVWPSWRAYSVKS